MKNLLNFWKSLHDVEFVNIIKRRSVSFDKPISGEGDNEFSLYDVIQPGNIPSPDSGLMEESNETNLLRAIQKLSKRESAIIKMSFGLAGQAVLSLHEIARTFNISTERVRQLRGGGIVKLRSFLNGSNTLLKEL